MSQAKRTVEITVCERFESNAGGVLEKAVDDAIGYLSVWSITSGTLPVAKIVCQDDGNISALYTNREGQFGYEIFGMYHESPDGVKSYSFHS